jgi:hypothetical protein
MTCGVDDYTTGDRDVAINIEFRGRTCRPDAEPARSINDRLLRIGGIESDYTITSVERPIASRYYDITATACPVLEASGYIYVACAVASVLSPSCYVDASCRAPAGGCLPGCKIDVAAAPSIGVITRLQGYASGSKCKNVVAVVST